MMPETILLYPGSFYLAQILRLSIISSLRKIQDFFPRRSSACQLLGRENIVRGDGADVPAVRPIYFGQIELLIPPNIELQFKTLSLTTLRKRPDNGRSIRT